MLVTTRRTDGGGSGRRLVSLAPWTRLAALAAATAE
jgi:hypothetical protein